MRVVMSSPSPSPSPSIVEANEAVPMSSDGFPEVQRFSSLLNYLNLCQADVTINTETLDGSITKRENNCWVVQDEDQELTAVQIVEKIEF